GARRDHAHLGARKGRPGWPGARRRSALGDTPARAGAQMKDLAARARVVAEARAFFAGRGFLEVETPLLVPSPGLDLHLDAFAVGSDRYLSTSPEYQMKR